MNRGLSIAVVLLLGFGSVAQAQTPCYAENPGPTFLDNVSMGGPNLLLGVKFTAPSALNVTRIEVFTGERTGTNTVGIWSHDQVNNQPGTDLGTGSWSMSTINSWQGADLPKAVQLTAATTYWMVWGCQNGSQCAVQGGTVLGQVYRGSFDGGQSWNGPWQFNDRHWKFQFFCGSTCPGYFLKYGSGCPNSLSKLADMDGSGCPTPGGTITVAINGGIGGAFGIVFIGSGQLSAYVTPYCQVQNLPLYAPNVGFLMPTTGSLQIVTVLPPSTPVPADIYIQYLYSDPPVLGGVAASNPLQMHIQ